MSLTFEADRYFNAFLVLRENDAAIQSKIRQGGNMGATERYTIGVETVCLAFSVELYLKDIFSLSGNPIPRGHHIRKLFDKLPDELQQDLYKIHTKNQYGFTLETFRSFLDTISTGFEDYRYLHEKSSASYYTGYAVEFIQSLKKLGSILRQTKAASTSDEESTKKLKGSNL